MQVPQVKISVITAKSGQDLYLFAEDTLRKIKDNRRYESIASAFAIYETSANAYIDAYVAAINRGTVEVQVKKNVKPAFKAAAKVFASILEGNCNGDSSYIVEAGFPLKENNPRPTPLEYLPPPFDVVAKAGDFKGSIKLKFKAHNTNFIHSYGVQISIDGGVTYQKTIVITKRSITLTNLPSRIDMHIRVCAFGANLLESEWSQPVIVAAL